MSESLAAAAALTADIRPEQHSWRRRPLRRGQEEHFGGGEVGCIASRAGASAERHAAVNLATALAQELKRSARWPCLLAVAAPDVTRTEPHSCSTGSRMYLLIVRVRRHCGAIADPRERLGWTASLGTIAWFEQMCNPVTVVAYGGHAFFDFDLTPVARQACFAACLTPCSLMGKTVVSSSLVCSSS